MALRTRILLIEDDTALVGSVRRLLESDGFEVQTATSADVAATLLAGDEPYAAVLSKVSERVARPGRGLNRVRQARPNLPVIWMADAATRTTALALGLEASETLLDSGDPEELKRRVRWAALSHVTSGEVLSARPAAPAPATTADPSEALVGESEAMARVRITIARVAAVDSPVLIVGETGTGKDLVARLIHHASARRARPLVVIDCGALPADLLEAELFGEPSAGSAANAGGWLEAARGGTLLLAEIGELRQSLQPRILHFLQGQAGGQLNGLRRRHVDVRIMASSQRDLRDVVAAGQFRADLFFRLAALQIELPPLRDHLEDIPALCTHVMTKLAHKLGTPALHVAPSALASLARYAFPGNVRELENLLEHAAVVTAGDKQSGSIGRAHLSAHVVTPKAVFQAGLPVEKGFALLGDMRAQLERDLIVRAVQRWPGLSNSQIASRLGTNRRILELRMKQHGIDKRGHRDDEATD